MIIPSHRNEQATGPLKPTYRKAVSRITRSLSAVYRTFTVPAALAGTEVVTSTVLLLGTATAGADLPLISTTTFPSFFDRFSSFVMTVFVPAGTRAQNRPEPVSSLSNS